MRLMLIDGGHDTSAWLADRITEFGFIPMVARSAEHILADGLASLASAFLFDTGGHPAQDASSIRRLRGAGAEQPLVVLSGQGDWRDKIACLDAGADDFLTKPVRSEEVAARLRAIIRRTARTATDRIAIGDLDIDLKARCAWRSGKCLDLTRNEFRLLRLFLTQPERVLAHREIKERIYADHADLSQNAVEVQIARLRRKVGKERIRTVRGVGYRFEAQADIEPAPASIAAEPCSRCAHGSTTAGELRVRSR